MSKGSICTLYTAENSWKIVRNSWKTPGICLVKMSGHPDKVLCNKAFNIAKNPKYDGYQGGLATMAYKLFR